MRVLTDRGQKAPYLVGIASRLAEDADILVVGAVVFSQLGVAAGQEAGLGSPTPHLVQEDPPAAFLVRTVRSHLRPTPADNAHPSLSGHS